MSKIRNETPGKPDPLQIVSPDGSETLSIGIDNSGGAAISGATAVNVNSGLNVGGPVNLNDSLSIAGAVRCVTGLATNALVGLNPGDIVSIGDDVLITGSLEVNDGSGASQVFDPIYNPVSVVTSASLVVNSPATIDLPNTTTPVNILTIPIPAAGQSAMIFDVALDLTMEYQSASAINQNFYLYLTTTSEGLLDFTKAVPSVTFTNGLNNQILTLTPITNNGVIEFTLQGSILRFYNTTGATVSNLYLAMAWQGGAPTSIGNLTDVNIYALVECRKGVFVA